MSLSVVIPAYNEEKYLGRTLESVREQGFKDFELIVVCNGCGDKSFEIASKYCDKVFNLKEGNVSKAKNFGAKGAKNEFLVFLDADTVLDKDVLEKVNEAMLEDKVFGTARGKGKGFQNKLYLGFKNLINRFFPWGHGFVFCDKKSFFDVGGFDESRPGRELRPFFSNIKGDYRRVNVFVQPSDRKIKKWGLLGLVGYWILGKAKEGYKAVR